jgi:hypothetical protein
MGGADGGDREAHIQTCDATGQWGAAAPCMVGRCQDEPVVGDAFCIADCLPGAKVCVGGPAAVPAGEPIGGTAAEATCSAQGLITAPIACGGGTRCRKSAAGIALGCVQCVGSVPNEAGLTDTRCRSAGGGAGSTHVETCGSNNQWPTTRSACPPGSVCTPATYSPGRYCHPCGPLSECSVTELEAFFGPGADCSIVGASAGACGGTPDCCNGFDPGDGDVCRRDDDPATCFTP